MITCYDDPPRGDARPDGPVPPRPRALRRPHRQIAADRAEVAAREDIRRSHLRTFSPDGLLLVFPCRGLTAIEHEVLLVHGREDRIIRK